MEKDLAKELNKKEKAARRGPDAFICGRRVSLIRRCSFLVQELPNRLFSRTDGEQNVAGGLSSPHTSFVCMHFIVIRDFKLL